MKYQNTFCVFVLAGLLLASFSVNPARSSETFEGIEGEVEEVHERSLQRRREVMEDALSQDSLWPDGGWGNLMWSLVALYQNDRVEEANERLFEKFDGRVLGDPGLNHSDRVRIFSLFNSHTGQYPGRLTPETENVMTEVLWDWVSSRSRVEHAETDENWPMPRKKTCSGAGITCPRIRR